MYLTESAGMLLSTVYCARRAFPFSTWGEGVAAIPVVNVGARLPQAALNWRRKTVGEQSVVTLALQWLGNLARVFTTLVQVRDPVVLCGSVASAVVNGALVGQWVWYTRKERAAAKREGRGGGGAAPVASR
ncbi:hypothetical protein I4F81_005162 [Pyropia yezoensis]|uniref:Uncharacterized protein n=1 Tax=Pyropia yezoensis TaxID=2788 RepID=A0ACC3BX14_PYRYE|nr:hypothetical protein I4F81_005162 [Neopyropia yezoensis]